MPYDRPGSRTTPSFGRYREGPIYTMAGTRRSIEPLSFRPNFNFQLQLMSADLRSGNLGVFGIYLRK